MSIQPHDIDLAIDHTVDLLLVDAILDKYGKDKSSLISVLHAVSESFRWLPREALLHISEVSGIGISHIISVASFYPQFRFTPAGRHRIKVCIGTACHVKGAQTVFNAVKQHLCIPDDSDTDPDRLFTVCRV
ncbi:MAG: NAD(P)H-dependent oxidoreductase subunit E, partial [Spirochaetaceae bacterium]